MPSYSAFECTNRSEKKKYFVPLSTLRKVEQVTLYKMDAKYKANLKLTIGWEIFYN